MTYCAIRPGPYDAGAYITASNNDDGVGLVVEKFMLA